MGLYFLPVFFFPFWGYSALTFYEDAVYLDHAGTTLYSKSLMERFASEMTSCLLGNPHSASASSQLSTSRIEDTRLRVLQFFNADPAEFDVVFVANATAGIKLVVEAIRAAPGGFNYVYHQASHTSLVGVREEARNSLCLDDARMHDWLDGSSSFDNMLQPGSTTLVAYPGQSNMDGQRFPLDWSARMRSLSRTSDDPVFTLLDAAALASTSPLDLSDSEGAPDFTVVSFYKIFGFPDLGALIVRRQAESVFSFKRYFGGGTVDTVVTGTKGVTSSGPTKPAMFTAEIATEQWHAPKGQFLHDRLEDGTLPIHSIIALDAAMTIHGQLFGKMHDVASHVSSLARRLRQGLRTLRHCNGTSVCTIYSHDHQPDAACLGTGPVVTFNIRNQAGAWASLSEFDKLASLKNFHIRTGGLCNPGGVASALGLKPWEMKRNYSSGFRCGGENDIIAGKPTGVIRASLGAMSTLSDVDAFIAFIDEFYREDSVCDLSQDTPELDQIDNDLFVSSITVYPIKSCGGFIIAENTDWEVRPEGLAWDREWCLLHRGSGQALSQKRYPKMALIQSFLDFKTGQLRVSYSGREPEHKGKAICVPLSANPALFQPVLSCRSTSSRVCGEDISAQTYNSESINSFFSNILGVQCVLARFPAGGQGKSARHSKAHLQKHQSTFMAEPLSSARLSTDLPSPPDSDAENERRKILLSNESPMLAINLASLRALNEEMVSKGGEEVSAAVFRANIVIDSSLLDKGKTRDTAYLEDDWSKIRIGQQEFKMLGSCRRCHMVCINQETGAKSEEPFVTLSKTRRFDGKVFFGTHMGHIQGPGPSPTIRVGDRVFVDT